MGICQHNSWKLILNKIIARVNGGNQHPNQRLITKDDTSVEYRHQIMQDVCTFNSSNSGCIISQS